MKSKKVKPIAFVLLVIMVISMVVTGALSYFSVYNESIHAISQQNNALINRLEGWLNVQKNRLVTNLVFLQEEEINAETLAHAFTVQGELDETISMIMVGLPDGGFIHGGEWAGAAEHNAPERIWYVAAAARPGEVFFLPPYWGPATQRFVFTVARTINDYDASEGVIAISMPFTAMQSYIYEYEAEYSFSFVLDEYGNILFHPDEAFAPISDGVFQNIRDVEGGRFVNMFDEIQSDGFSVGDGEVRVGAISDITGWYVITQVPLSYIINTTMPTILSLVVTAFFALVAASATFYFLKKLHIVYEEVRHASSAKTAFIANMSHEIRTPMNSIVGFSELALEETQSEKTQTYMNLIIENSRWLLQIINDILDISKIESGNMQLENAPFNLGKFLHDCESTFLPHSIEKDIKLTFITDDEINKTTVMGDSIRLRQVFTNLLSNAIKFTKKGDITISSTITNTIGMKKTVSFQVKDTGIGLSAEQVKQIFKPFVQADTSITRKYGGTGLGLPITQNLLKMMGGLLTAESTQGRGTTFSFELTFDTIEIVEEPQKKDISDSKKTFFDGEVLVCEDNKMNQLVISEHLQRVGLKFVIAENGKQGVDLVMERLKTGNMFDIILMDIYMPVMDGIEATAKISKMTVVPIVAMTANIMDSDLEIYKQSGMTDYIGKPFTSMELRRCLKKFFEPMDSPANSIHPAEESVISDTALQKRLLASFQKDNADTFDKITKCIDNEDFITAHRLAHSLKGSAALVGKIRLQHAAAQVESLFKSGDTDDRLLKILKTELDAILHEMELTDIPEEAPANTPQEKQSILIVDDTPINLRALSYIFGGEYKIIAASDGPTAIELAHKQQPELILLDIIMPDMDGYDVLAALKASEETKNIPVIFVSGIDGDLEEKGVELGVADYIHKPYTPNIAKLRVKNQFKILAQQKKLNPPALGELKPE